MITGAAPFSGKSTLVRSILAGAEPFKRVDYGQLLLDHKARQTGVRMTYEELRRDSATAITPEDVRTVDEWLIGQLPQWRTTANLLIDSHPVTKEDFGFRVTPFSLEQIRQIQFDVILVLVGEPEQLAQRVALEAARPASRQRLSVWISSLPPIRNRCPLCRHMRKAMFRSGYDSARRRTGRRCGAQTSRRIGRTNDAVLENRLIQT